MHAVKPVGSPFSSPLGLQLALRLLTSPADQHSALLEALLSVEGDVTWFMGKEGGRRWERNAGTVQ